jgi:hypothetical protein
MANVHETADWLAMEALDILTNKLAISQYMNTEYSSQFKLRYPVGDTIRVPYPQMGTIRNGLVYTPSDMEPRHATIEIFPPFGIDFELDSIERALETPKSREQFSKLHIEPKVSQLAQEIESRCALYAYQHAASVVGSLGINPTTYDATSAAALQTMTELACPESGDKGMFLPPAVHRAVKTTNIALRNPVEMISKQMRRGYVEQADDFDWYRSNSLHRHTAGTWAGAVTVTAAPANGATSVTITAGAGDTFAVGDKISFALVRPVNPMTKRLFGPATQLKTFTVTAALTAAGGGADVLNFSPAIYATGPHQNVNVLPAAGAALTLWPGTAAPNGANGIVGLAIHPNAYGLVGIELERFTDQEACSLQRDPTSGLSIRYTRGSDIRLSKKLNRFDIVLGMGEFFNDSCVVAVACG